MERLSGLEEIESTLGRCGAAIEKLRELQPGEMAAFRKCADFEPIETFVERKFDFQNSLKSAIELDEAAAIESAFEELFKEVQKIPDTNLHSVSEKTQNMMPLKGEIVKFASSFVSI